jgi:hypothetical protein
MRAQREQRFLIEVERFAAHAGEGARGPECLR